MYTTQIPAALIRGAMACQAKKDVRYYLNGILLAANGDVVGTNGHCMFKGNAPERVENDTIIVIDGKIPTTAETVSFDFDALTCKTDKNKVFAIRIIDDAKYPDYNRVIPTLPRDSHSTGFGVNASYLGKAAQAFGENAPIAVYPASENDSVLIQYMGKNEALESAVFVVIPLRAGSFNPLYTSEQDARIRTEIAERKAS